MELLRNSILCIKQGNGKRIYDVGSIQKRALNYKVKYFWLDLKRNSTEYLIQMNSTIELRGHPKGVLFNEKAAVYIYVELDQQRLDRVRGRSQTTFTRFGFFRPPTSLRLHFL